MDQFVNETVNQDLRLTVLDEFPPELLSVEACDLHSHLNGPTLFHLSGAKTKPLFITVLLHGNETTGWDAIRHLFKKYLDNEFPRSIVLFVGNIAAARANVRTLSNQLDYNRAWPGSEHLGFPETKLMADVFQKVKECSPFASIDVHNNTGTNPFYGCVNELEDDYLYLASLFSRTIVYFKRPKGVQSLALSQLCPAVTIECGRVGMPQAVEKTAGYLEAALRLSDFPKHPIRAEDIDLLQTHAIVKLPKDASFSFDGSDADFMFRSDLDRMNFSEISAGTLFGTLGCLKQKHLLMFPGEESDLTEDYFNYEDADIRLKQPTIPAMLTLDPNAIRSDCLGYLMKRINRG